MAFIVVPTWFYGIDSIFDMVSVIVGLLISYFAYKTYRYTSEKKYFYFSMSFFLVALAFVAKILATIPIYSKALKVETAGLLTVTNQIVDKATLANQFGISISRFIMLFAFLLLLLVSLKVKDKVIIGLLVYFLVISTSFVSRSYTVFHTTLLLMLGGLFYYYMKNYLRIKSSNAKMVMYSFLLLLIGQIVFLFVVFINFILGVLIKSLSVIGESLQLAGFLLLLFAMIKLMVKK